MVKSLVAIEGPRVRFPADAYFFIFCFSTWVSSYGAVTHARKHTQTQIVLYITPPTRLSDEVVRQPHEAPYRCFYLCIGALESYARVVFSWTVLPFLQNTTRFLIPVVAVVVGYLLSVIFRVNLAEWSLSVSF